jgi:hypothetical protein
MSEPPIPAIKIVSVSFHVDLAGSGAAGALQFADHNTDQNCGWLETYGGRPPVSVRSPTCGGVTLPTLRPMTKSQYAGRGCVLRLDVSDPNSTVHRTGHFTFKFQTQCVDRVVAPCDRLTEPPTAEHPVTVQWSPRDFYVAACGPGYGQEIDPIVAAGGGCPNRSPSASPSS